MPHHIIRLFTLTLAIVVGLSVTPVAAESSGTFTGASRHVTTGMVSVVKNSDGTATVTLHEDFFFDGAPDPRVGFGKSGKYIAASDLGKLKTNTGAQTYVVPASINVDDFNEVYVWCRKFSVPLGVAALN